MDFIKAMMPTSKKTPPLYFGYGSNLWLAQMKQRCPHSTYAGVGKLSSYRWMINSRGYANVVPVDDASSVVYGLVYRLTPQDESNLDKNEGVPESYTKEIMNIDFWPSKGESKVDITKPADQKDALVYIDRKRVDDSVPKKEYIYRMNRGIDDAIAMGVPSDYIQKSLRPFIPSEYSKAAEDLALQQANNFQDDLDP